MYNDIEDPTPAIVPDGADDDDIAVIANINSQMYALASLYQVREMRAETLADEGIIKRVFGWNKTRLMRKDVINRWNTHMMMRDVVMEHIHKKMEVITDA